MEHSDRYETLPERLIREAIEVGELEELPGRGRPIPGAGQPDDELWWVRAWIRRSAPERGSGRSHDDDAGPQR